MGRRTLLPIFFLVQKKYIIMIYNTEVEINGVKYKYTYSDKYKIKKVGTEEVYDSAYDVIDSDFEYTETTEELEEITEDTIDN